MAFLTPASAGERDTLKTFLMQQLSQLRAAAYGLTDEQFLAAPSASSLSIGALLVHAVEGPRYWLEWSLREADVRPQPDMAACQRIAAEHPVPEFLREFDARVARLGTLIDRIQDLGDHVDVPDAPWFPKELQGWETRWVLCHLIAELARHAGHADIIRETIDGKTAYELNARSDGELADDQEFSPLG